MSNSNELYHYGVLGMKWGIRRGRYAQSYSKGVKKLKKLDKRADDYDTEAKVQLYLASKGYNKMHKTRNEKKRRRIMEKASAREVAAHKLHKDAAMCREKGREFYKKMEKAFADVDVKQLNREDIEYGKKYVNRILH